MTIFEKKRKQNRSRPSSLPILFGSTFLSSLRQTFLPLHHISFTYSPTRSTLPLPDPTSTNLVQQLNHKAQFAQSGGSTPSSNNKKKKMYRQAREKVTMMKSYNSFSSAAQALFAWGGMPILHTKKLI
jgi:hypothetical protein